MSTQGIFIGVSVEAATVVTRKEANRDFYGMHISAKELLMGDFPPPKAAEPLYKALEEVRFDVKTRGCFCRECVPGSRGTIFSCFVACISVFVDGANKCATSPTPPSAKFPIPYVDSGFRAKPRQTMIHASSYGFFFFPSSRDSNTHKICNNKKGFLLIFVLSSKKQNKTP